MYRLTENEFFEKGICRYEDEYENKVMMKRGRDGFVARLRLHDKNIIAEPLRVSFPPVGDGIKLKLNKTCDAEDVQKGISGFVKLIQYWISMEAALRTFNADNSYFRRDNKSDEDIWKDKLRALSQFAEVRPTIARVFGN